MPRSPFSTLKGSSLNLTPTVTFFPVMTFYALSNLLSSRIAPRFHSQRFKFIQGSLSPALFSVFFSVPQYGSFKIFFTPLKKFSISTGPFSAPGPSPVLHFLPSKLQRIRPAECSPKYYLLFNQAFLFSLVSKVPSPGFRFLMGKERFSLLFASLATLCSYAKAFFSFAVHDDSPPSVSVEMWCSVSPGQILLSLF